MNIYLLVFLHKNNIPITEIYSQTNCTYANITIFVLKISAISTRCQHTMQQVKHSDKIQTPKICNHPYTAQNMKT